MVSWQKSEYPGIAKLVSRLVWEKPPGQVHNFISGCCAVGSAPALGAGGPGFESPHSDHLWQKNRLFRRFFCVFCSVFAVRTIAVQRWFQGQKGGRSISEDSRRNRQIPNPSLTGLFLIFFLSIVNNRDYDVKSKHSYDGHMKILPAHLERRDFVEVIICLDRRIPKYQTTRIYRR